MPDTMATDANKITVEPHISNFVSEIGLRRSRLGFPSMVIAIVRRHLALLLKKKGLKEPTLS